MKSIESMEFGGKRSLLMLKVHPAYKICSQCTIASNTTQFGLC